MAACRVISALRAAAPAVVMGLRAWGSSDRVWSPGAKWLTRPAWAVSVLLVCKASTIEMPAEDPRLRTRVNTAEPSARKIGFRLAKARVVRGTNTVEVPRPWITADTIRGVE